MRGNASPCHWISEAFFGRSSPLAQNGWVPGSCLSGEGCIKCACTLHVGTRIYLESVVQSPYPGEGREGGAASRLSQAVVVVVAFPLPNSSQPSAQLGHKPQNSPAGRLPGTNSWTLFFPHTRSQSFFPSQILSSSRLRPRLGSVSPFLARNSMAYASRRLSVERNYLHETKVVSSVERHSAPELC